MTTRKMFRDELTPGACPECAAITLDYGLPTLDGWNIRQEVKCLDCGCGWFDTWTLSTRTIDRGRHPTVIEFY
jgi:hypothetical protein